MTPHLLQPPIRFSASVISGAGRGKQMGIPTLNLALTDVPPALEQGIFACRALLPGETETCMAAMHFGPRPVFKDDIACEVHLLDRELVGTPPVVEIVVIAWLRPVQDFPSSDGLRLQIAEDIWHTRRLAGQDPL